MVWAEQGKYPNVIIELLSDSTANVDRGLKKTLYQNTFRTPECFWFHPDTQEFKGFHLTNGKYRSIKSNAQGWLWSKQLELYLGEHEPKLRFFTAKGELVSSPKEEAERVQQQIEAERQRAEQAQQQADAERQQREELQRQVEELQARLRSLGLE